jgi:putative aminopeptidase FrvX
MEFLSDMPGLLKSLCEVHSPSGEEWKMKDFILEYIDKNSTAWVQKPIIVEGEHFQDCLILLFGNPKIAAFAHMDTTGFTVRYQDQLVPIGGPEVGGGEIVQGFDALGEIECTLLMDEDGYIRYQFGRGIATGTSLVYKSNYVDRKQHIQSPYLDNRIGIYNLLKVAETIEDGALVFSAWEEHGGGSVPFLVKYLYEKFRIDKMLVSDVTWATEGVHLKGGVVISYRDRSIPRRSFIDQIIKIAAENQILYQEEVEAHGASDGREIQASPYPIDWCFIGPPIENVHTNKERIEKSDLEWTIKFYKLLFQKILVSKI